jgi:TonB family protein
MTKGLLAFLLLGPATVAPQTSADLSTKYHQITSYELRPDVVMTPKYGADGQVCEMDIERRHKTDTGIIFGSSFSKKDVRELVDELVPAKERGKDLTEFLNSTIDGGFITTEYSYENIVVTVRGITRPQPEDMVVVITWRKRTCSQGEQLASWSTAQNKPVNSPSAAQKTASDLPKVIRASVPSYPELARQTRIQGTVTLRVSTDGKLVSDVDAESGHPILAKAATENVKTWEFKPHAPTTFEVSFHYRLFVPDCDSECNCDRGERGETESVLLHLPTDADVSAPTLLTCDPAEEISQRRTIWRRLIHLITFFY